jgi:hypothetical protein
MHKKSQSLLLEIVQIQFVYEQNPGSICSFHVGDCDSRLSSFRFNIPALRFKQARGQQDM